MGLCSPHPSVFTNLLYTLILLAFSSISSSLTVNPVLKLDRIIPIEHDLKLERIVARDSARHSRLFQGIGGGVVDFSVIGSSDPFLVGLYFTKVKIGTPPTEFNVQIDTGSDVLWVNCRSCSNCPQSSGLGIDLDFFDATISSTSGVVLCTDPACASSVDTATTLCSQDNNQCSYSFQYGDGSGTSGYYVSDMFHFDSILDRSVVANSSSLVVFGCSTFQSGGLTKTDKAVDGILGFGPGELSVISQLSSRGVSPKVFSHCLKGDSNGGGILVLGEILEPSMVFTPLVPFQPHYNLQLQSVSVNGIILPIDPGVFTTGMNKGTIVDSGTTLAYLVGEAFDALILAITSSVSHGAIPATSKENQYCYFVPESVYDVFPTISLNFAGDASLLLNPKDYLVPAGYHQNGDSLLCIGFVRVDSVSILGDLVLKDKIFVYDLSRQRIGWANYDCSTAVNVSVSGSKDFINAGQISVSGASRDITIRILSLTSWFVLTWITLVGL